MNYAYIFDLDGTLIDTPSGIVETFIEVLTSMGVKNTDAPTIRATIGLPLEKAFGSLLQVDPNDVKVANAITQYQLFFKKIVLPNAKKLIFPGVEKGLETLKSQGFLLAVATSKFYASAEALLKAAGLFEYFNLVVGADQVSHPKPHPEMGFLVMKKLDVLPENAVMVGDTTHDLLMAKDAGMHSIAVTYGIHDIEKLKLSKPTWIVNTFDEVLKCNFMVQI